MTLLQASDAMSLPAVWAVVAHYGDPAITMRLIEKLRSSTTTMDIVVVDNSGNLDAPENVRYLQPTGNLGFAGGANAGAQFALAQGADLVWFVNNDAEPGPRALEQLLETVHECHPACVVGSLEIDPAESDAQRAAAYLLPGLPRGRRGLARVVRGSRASVDFVSGFSMVVSRPVFNTVGFLDETFFHFCEDVDFCLRAARVGVDVVLDCGAPVVHRRSTALGKRSQVTSYYFFRNRLLLTARHRGVHPLVSLLVSDPRSGLLQLFSPKRIARRDWAWLSGAWLGTLDGLRRRTGPARIGGSRRLPRHTGG